MAHYFLISKDGEDYETCDADMNRQGNGLMWTNFIKGVRFSNGEVQETIIVELEHPENVMPEWFEAPLFLGESLIKDLLEFGIDNLNFYDTKLVDSESGKVWTDYKLCNIIGKIDVFDMDKSETHPDSLPCDAYLFNKIVIDEEKAKGNHIFRLYGRSSEIMVSDELKDYLESKGKYPHMEFVHPSEFG